MLEDEEIRDIVWKEEDFTSLPGKLVEAANNQGGRDNISVVLVKPE